MSNVNLNETAPTQFQDIGGVSLAYRHFGKEGAWKSSIDRTAPSRNARWTCSFRRARRVTRRARPGSSGSPRESWTANQTRSPRSPRPNSSLLLNGGAIPATDRYGDLKKIKQRTL